jgi:excisionase family DNA binding protein
LFSYDQQKVLVNHSIGVIGISRDQEKECAMNRDEPATFTVEEAAKLLRIGRNQGYEAARTGDLPSIRIGKRILVPRVALERLLTVTPAATRLPARKTPDQHTGSLSVAGQARFVSRVTSAWAKSRRPAP